MKTSTKPTLTRYVM